LIALWRPRVANAAKWFVEAERARRRKITRSYLEVRGERQFGDFRLYGIADRIDELKTGGGAIVDYKTGNVPTRPQVASLLTPQLPLEGAILMAGGFPGISSLAPQELLYIKFSGGSEGGKEQDTPDALALSQKAAEKLAERVATFDNPETSYPSRLKPYRSDIPGDYDHLARVREWSLTGWSEGDE
jgi:ATP-dependent helicase/nuclease subunit B